MALGGRTFGGYIAEGAAGIKCIAGIMYKDIIECVTGTTKRNFKFFAGSKRSHFAQMHNRDPVTMAFRLLKVMSGKK